MQRPLTLISWNVNGARAVHKKGFMDWFMDVSADVLCLQETRAEESQLPAELAQPDGYMGYWNASRRKKGYSGTAVLTKTRPNEVRYGLGYDEFDQEGRTIIAIFSTFTLLNCYFPNGGRDHSRVPFKLAIYTAFLDTCERLRSEGHNVLFCGDVNTAHKEIDLARPRENQNTTGLLPQERAWIDQVFEAGYVDTFRHFYPDLAEQYTWWSVPTRARERNVGWRLDYFFIAPELLDRVVDAFILPDVTGSDHCPVGLRLRV
jgi:exodeoxyribonuclease-3